LLLLLLFEFVASKRPEWVARTVVQRWCSSLSDEALSQNCQRFLCWRKSFWIRQANSVSQ